LRYCLRPILYLPIVLIHLRSSHRAYAALFTIQIAALQVALMSVRQGLTGMSATPGPFLTGNQLGGVLVMPILMAMIGILLPIHRLHFWISFLSLPILLRSLLYCESRGAMVAVFAGMIFLLAMLVHQRIGRKRLQWFSPLFLIGFIAILPAMPIILSRPTVKHALSASDAGEDSNMKWRIEQRWPHFWAIATDNPWLGVGTEVDASLGPKANTPHNGFLAMAVLWGFPAASIVIALALRCVFNGVALYRRARDPDHRVFGLIVSSAMFAMLTHQIVEVTLIAVFPYKVFWLFLGTSELARRWPDGAPEASASYLTRRQLHGFEPLPSPAAAPRESPAS
ncbi:MAG: O-antigen ligase family protein, partial [Acidobacteriota bacterium]